MHELPDSQGQTARFETVDEKVQQPVASHSQAAQVEETKGGAPGVGKAQ